jgi:prophage antirepressor-like protein
MTSIQLYSNEDFSVRTTRDENDTVWFVAKDIAQALEYELDGGTGKYFSHVPEQWKQGKRISVRSENGVVQEREMLCLTEQGVYFFLGRSDKPKALPYQMWIAGDVVPSIRETGSYSLNEYHPSISKTELEGIAYFYEYAGLRGNQATLALDKYIKSCIGRSALETAGIQLNAPTQNQILTPTEIGRIFGMSAIRVNEILAGAGLQHKVSGRWEAIEDGLTYAVMQDTGKAHSDGTPIRQLKWDSSILGMFENLLVQDDCGLGF